ncbi:hypothetical protein ACB092_04G099700 [Castanea dentata]
MELVISYSSPSCLTASTLYYQSNTLVLERKQTNYHPSIWDKKLFESLSTPYSYESHATRLEGPKQDVKNLLTSTKDPSVLMKLIDSMQRLGVDYHFEKEIEKVLGIQHPDVTSDLYTTALLFRIVRERGFPISSDVFDKFRSSDGRFMDSLSRDVEGLLSLYEATHLGMHGENILEEARDFRMKNLDSLMKILDNYSAKKVKQSLEMPLYWRIPRNINLLELAKLDYNLVQSVYQQDLKELERRWRDLGFKDNLKFSRDRLVENYLGAMGTISEPHLIGLTKYVCIITAIDDMYNVYGLLDELESFTDSVNRWEMENLPEYMKICYVAILNFVNEMVCDVCKHQDLNILPYIKEEWANLCRSHLIEARWFRSGYIPTVNEYLENSCISVGAYAAAIQTYITRLSNDLATWEVESKRGDVVKSIQYYMVHKGISEVEARHRIKELISYSWKKLNEESAKNSLPKSMIKMTLNMARTSQCIYQYGDGINTSTGAFKELLTSLIVKPILIE